MHINITFYHIARLGRMDLCRRRHHANVSVSAAEYVHSNAHKVIAGFFSKFRSGGDVEVQLPS
jgi:hypothetical protein